MVTEEGHEITQLIGAPDNLSSSSPHSTADPNVCRHFQPSLSIGVHVGGSSRGEAVSDAPVGSVVYKVEPL